MYLVFHQIHSSVPLRKISCHNVIEQLLKKVNTCLTIHCWQENETDIMTLGFFINVNPGNFLEEKFKEHLHTQISKHNKIDKKKIPPPKYSYSMPFAIDIAGYHTSTKAYDIQCWHHDAKTLTKYI